VAHSRHQNWAAAIPLVGEARDLTQSFPQVPLKLFGRGNGAEGEKVRETVFVGLGIGPL
jgi:hypothetical protein